MSDFQVKKHQNSISAAALPQGELNYSAIQTP